MGRSRSPESIPQLEKLGLMPVKTVGDGNCLFNALSDQLHGDDSQAAVYRAAVVQHMRENKEDYLPFIGLLPRGATRRNPKRKVAGSPRFEYTAVTSEQINEAFDDRMNQMAQGGTWGDNHEIVAFSKVYEVDILIWSIPANDWFRIIAPGYVGLEKSTLFILLHEYEHYSSIRNIDGPFTGIPNVQDPEKTPEGIVQMKLELIKVEEWKIKSVMKALPYPLNQPENRANVQKTLQQCNGRMDDAVHYLLPDSSPGSTSPSSGERDADSDDEEDQKPHKKRDRRASRPNPLHPNLEIPVPGRDPLIVSPNPIYLVAALNKVANEDSKQPDQTDPDETEEENWKDLMFKDSSESPSSSASRSSSPPPKRASTDIPRIRLRLTKPKTQGQIQDNDLISEASSLSSQSNVADTEADPDDATKTVKKQARAIAKHRRRRQGPGSQRTRLLTQQNARDSDNDSVTPALGRNNSIKKLDSSIGAICI